MFGVLADDGRAVARARRRVPGRTRGRGPDAHRATAYGRPNDRGKGVEAAAEVPLLRPHALDDAAWRPTRPGCPVAAPRPYEFVRWKHEQGRCRHLERFLAVRREADRRNGSIATDRLTGIGKFSRVGYRIITEQGREGLLVTLEENGYAPPMLQLAFEVDGSDAGNVGFTLANRLTIMDLGGYRSEWRTDLLFGSVYGIESEYYRPVTASSKWFVAPHAGASRSAVEIYQKDVPSAEYRVDASTLGVDVGYGFSRLHRCARIRGGISRSTCGSGIRAAGCGREPGCHSVPVRHDHTTTRDPAPGATVETSFSWYDRSPGAGALPVGSVRASSSNPSRAGHPCLAAPGGTTFGELDTGLPSSRWAVRSGSPPMD